jgi:glycosyltransferase involved in cell wall biosynthesis
MRIAIDLSAIQSDHRFRGIGQTIVNFINNVSEKDKQKNQFIFYIDKKSVDEKSVLNIFDLENMDFEVRYLKPLRNIRNRFSGRLSVIITGLNQLLRLKDYYLGDKRIGKLRDVDVFLQCDQSHTLPPRGKQKNIFFAYDLIPYVLEWDYLWNFKTTRIKGYSRRYATRQALKRWFYIKKIRINCKRAHRILAISEQTKNDFTKYAKVNPSKISVIQLGVDQNLDVSSVHDSRTFTRYIQNSWGYKSTEYKVEKDDKFILYVGGADKRRKLEELVTAYNHIQGQGKSLKLVLAGDSMQGPSEISNQVVRASLEESSYYDDIIFLGFISKQDREWLYAHATAFVYPSRYEGFGLPVVEAMSRGTPVICYPNNAVMSLLKGRVWYARNSSDILHHVLTLLHNPLSKKEKEKLSKEASRYDWVNTSSQIIQKLH